MNALELHGLKKSFGTQVVIDGLDLRIPEHCVFGFLGQNGAGKTTTMKMILGLLKADAGEILVFGKPVRFGRTKTNRHIGYLPDVPEFYTYMTAREYLKLCGEITGLDKNTVRERSEELLTLVGLGEEKKRIGGYSRGMKQRLGIAQALLNEPRLLICDEPTSALDPVGRKEILEILQKIKKKTTVVFSTHVLSDVERICDTIALLNQGKIVLSGTIAALREHHRSNVISIEFLTPGDCLRFTKLPAVQQAADLRTSGNTVSLHCSDIEAAQSAVLESLNGLKLFPVKLELAEASLETLFMEAVQ